MSAPALLPGAYQILPVTPTWNIGALVLLRGEGNAPKVGAQSATSTS